MASLDDSVSIVKHFCYTCQESIDILSIDMLTTEQICGRCGTGFIEEILLTPEKSKEFKCPEQTEELEEQSKGKSKQLKEKSPEKNDCSICLQEMDAEEIVKLVCKHSFHKSCVKVWFQRANNCPLCRGKVDVPSVVTPPISQVINIRSAGRHAYRRGDRSRSPIDQLNLGRRPIRRLDPNIMSGQQIQTFLRELQNVRHQQRTRMTAPNNGHLINSPLSNNSAQREGPEFSWVFPPEFDVRTIGRATDDQRRPTFSISSFQNGDLINLNTPDSS